MFPEEIEAALMQIEGITQAVVVPISDDEFGQRPVAFVQLNDEGRTTVAEIRTALEVMLPHFKWPVRFFKWPEAVENSELKPARWLFSEIVRRQTARELT